MRKFVTAVVFSLGLACFSAASVAATPPADTEQALILKKKKRLAVLKAAARAEEQALAKAEAAAKARKRQEAASIRNRKGVRIVVSSAATGAKPRKDRLLATSSGQARRACGSFMQCLFARKQRPVRVASIDPSFTGAGSGMSGRSMRQTVDWNETRYKPGTIVVKTPERALYYVLPGGEAIRYSVGVGREGFQWGGRSTIVSKQEWPSWTPPQVMIEREAAKGHIIPPFMEGGPGNPLGARAMYIGGTMFRVHGTNNEASIGGAVSSGCIRMMNADVVDLFDRVRVGSPIVVIQ